MKLETLNSIWENGRKYTLVKFNDLGFPYAIKLTAKELIIEKYAQYPETARLVFKQKGKRKLRQVRIYPHTTFVLFRDWVEPDVNMYRDFNYDDSGKVECSKSLLCFSDEYLRIARESVPNEKCVAAYYE